MKPNSDQPELVIPDSGAPAPGPAVETVQPPLHHPIRVLGIGTTGSSVIRQLVGQGLPCCTAIHTDPHALEGLPPDSALLIDSPALRGSGTAGDPERGRAAAEDQLTQLRPLCEGAKMVLIVLGLGGGTGTGFAPVLARVAREAGATVIALTALPFDCEGNLRARIAAHGLERLRQTSDFVVAQSNQEATPALDSNASLLDIFKGPNAILAGTVQLIWQAFSAQTVMGLGLSELTGLLAQRSRVAALAVADAAGESRADRAVDALLKHPLLGGSDRLKAADILGVLILGGPSLTMGEVNRVMARVHAGCGSAPLLMGAAILPDLDGSLRLGMMTIRAGQSDPVIATPEVVENPVATPADPVIAPPSQNRLDPVPDSSLLKTEGPLALPRPGSRFVAPPPENTPERIEELRKRRKTTSRMRQEQLPLEIVSKGRFEKSEPTIHKGEDLDIPTYIRRRVSLN